MEDAKSDMKNFIPYLLGCVFAAMLLPTTVSAQTTLFYESFENPETFTNNWTVGSGFPEEENPVLWGVVDKDFGRVPPRSGTNQLYCAGIGHGGDTEWPIYPDFTSNFIEREVDLTHFKSATLSFWYRFRVYDGRHPEFEFDEFWNDFLYVYVDENEVFSTANFEEPNPVTSWTRVTIDLSAYTGKPATIRFGFESDGDSQDDPIRARDGAYLDDLLLIAYPANRADIDNNGSADLIFQHNTDWRAMAWKMNGTTVSASQALNAGKTLGAWRIVGQADFDRDGDSDLFLHAPSTGATLAWFMNGAVKERQRAIRTMTKGWNVRAMADLNKDGSQDVIWQNAAGNLVAWYMNPTNQSAYLKQAAFNKAVGTTFKVVGTSDFNFDGSQDLLLQDNRTGSLRVRYLSGLKSISASDPYIALTTPLKFSTAWRAVGTQDFNADGQPDLIMHHTNGTVAIWFLDGLKVTGQQILKKSQIPFVVSGHR